MSAGIRSGGTTTFPRGGVVCRLCCTGVHWARLRKAEVDPRRVVAAWLAVEMVIAADPQPVSASEFKRVQAAKLVHRLASGTHKRWEREQADPSWSGLRTMTVVEEKHWYPRSRGRVLRYIGEDLESAVELLTGHHLRDAQATVRLEAISLAEL